MEHNRKKLKKRWIVLIVLAVLIVVLAGGVFAMAKGYLAQIDRTYKDPVDTIAPEDEFFDTDETPSIEPSQEPVPTAAPSAEPTAAPSQEPSAEPTAAPSPEPSADPGILYIDPEDVEWDFIERIEDDHLINILLVGQDKYPGETYTGRQRSDTMILCSINPETGETALISFLRDLYVQLPGGYSDNRLNVPYVLGGFPLLDETLALNFGISVDVNFEIDLAAFEALVDLVGGVDIDLTAAEADYFRRNWDSSIVEGVNHLNGANARIFAQIRVLDSDFGRTNRQREVLLAIYDKIQNLPVGQLLDLMYKALGYMTTDMTDGQILSLAYRLLPLVSSMKIETYAVPASNAYTRAYVNGMDVLLPKLQVIHDQLEDEYLPLH